MKIGRQRTFVGILFVASTVIAAAFIVFPQVLRIILGILIVFFLPGFATIRAAFPSKEFTRIELMLASLGISLAATICMTVLLAALPIGLTQGSLSIVLGASTAIVTIYAWFRMRFDASRQRKLETKSTVSYSRKKRY